MNNAYIPTITDIVMRTGSGEVKHSHFRTTIYPNVLAYKDRQWFFTEYPPGWKGLGFLQGEEKFGCYNSFDYLSFKFDRPGMVYIGYPLDREKPPGWLQNYFRHPGIMRVDKIKETYHIFMYPYLSAGLVCLPGPAYQSNRSRPPYLVMVGAIELVSNVGVK